MILQISYDRKNGRWTPATAGSTYFCASAESAIEKTVNQQNTNGAILLIYIGIGNI